MKLIWILAAVTALQACNHSHNKEQQKPVTAPMTAVHKDTAMMKLEFDSKKDLVCGMPVSAGITDTVRYKNKLYGFCSKECREEFLKSPGSLFKE